jgi:hypothetical protein
LVRKFRGAPQARPNSRQTNFRFMPLVFPVFRPVLQKKCPQDYV